MVTDLMPKARTNQFDAINLTGSAPSDTTDQGMRRLGREGDIYVNFNFQTDGEYTLQGATVGLKLMLPVASRFRPFAKGGVTFNNLKSTYGSSSTSRTIADTAGRCRRPSAGTCAGGARTLGVRGPSLSPGRRTLAGR